LITAVTECAGTLFKRVDLLARLSVHVSDSQTLDSESSVQFVATNKNMNGRNIPVHSIDRRRRIYEPKDHFPKHKLDLLQKLVILDVRRTKVDQMLSFLLNFYW
jgi:hypothetical protein